MARPRTAVARLGAWARRVRAEPGRRVPRALATALVVALAALAGVWLVRGEDERGDTARLTADAWYYHAYLPSLVLEGDLDFTDEYRITNNWYRLGETEIGRPKNVFGIGPAVFEAPFFLAGHAAARAAGEDANGFSRPEVLAALSASLAASVAALIPAFLLVRRRLGDGALARLAPAMIAAGGPVVYYAVRQPGYAHPFATLAVAWLIERWDASYERSERPRRLRTWLGFGALVGAAALARPQCALWAVVLLAAAADDVRRACRGAAAGARVRAVLRGPAVRWLAGAVVSVIIFSPQLLAWEAIYGAYLTVPQGPGFMWWDAPAWSEVLMSSRNGLLPWAPVHALALVGLALAAVRTPRVGIALAAGVALQAVTNGAVWDWWAGGSFGGRRFDSAYVAFAYGLAAVVVVPAAAARWRRPWRWARRAAAVAAGLVAAILACANVCLAASYSAPTARIHGGEAAHRVIERRVPGALGRIAAAASHLANAPARWAFAARYGTGADAYDRIVGEHVLGELYPGLNSFRGKTRERIRLASAGDPRLLGVAGDCDACTRVVAGEARILVGLNRRGAIGFSLRAAAPPGREEAHVELVVNGERVAADELGQGRGSIEGTAATVRRGINVVTVRAPAGTRLYALTLRARRPLLPPGRGR